MIARNAVVVVPVLVVARGGRCCGKTPKGEVTAHSYAFFYPNGCVG